MQVDIGQKVGTAIASLGSFITAYVASETVINEFVRLFSSSLIAIIGAILGFVVTRWLKNWERRDNEKRERGRKHFEEQENDGTNEQV